MYRLLNDQQRCQFRTAVEMNYHPHTLTTWQNCTHERWLVKYVKINQFEIDLMKELHKNTPTLAFDDRTPKSAEQVSKTTTKD